MADSPAAVEQVQDGVVAESPTAEGAKETQAASPLEAVQAALAEDKADAEARQNDVEAGQPDSPEQAGEGKQEASADSHEEFVKSLSPSKREHWKRLEAERDSYKERATAFDKVAGAMREAGMDNTEFNAGFHVMRTIKAVQNGQASPTDALALLEPYVNQLRAMAGDILPDDLQERVSTGIISQDEARELARLRGENQRLQTRVAQETERTTLETQQRHSQELAASMGMAVTKWEQAWATSDPDYEVKKSLVKARITELMTTEGLPKTADDAVKLSERARKDIEQNLGGLLGKRSELRSVTGGRPSATQQPAPKSPMDVVNRALSSNG